MEDEQKIRDEQFWKVEIKKHWKVLILFIAVVVVLSIIGVYVLIWQIQTSPIGNYGKATFDQWSLEWVVIFLIMLILWELLFVGLPAALLFGLGGYLWWQRLPGEERAEFKEHRSTHKKARGGCGCGIFMFIAYCIYIAIDGNFSTPFGNKPYSYWVYSYLLTIGWLLIIIGIPMAIIGLIYLRYWLNKP
ncbi:MAG: hypothetical protein EU539_07360 [Promethearchaeota archaeon]|nr:MAG: hypothetical protein EU539_07360 [Candidatus Lokiarchaeota archaeon]